MSIEREVNIRERRLCAVCGSASLEATIALPRLPLTGVYCRTPMPDLAGGIDQHLLMCSECGHGQLGRVVPARVLYDDTYSFRTSCSATAQHGTEVFLRTLEDLAPYGMFKCALDLGCNDLYLLRRLRGRATVRVGIDPVVASVDLGERDPDIVLIGDTVENVDLRAVLDVPPDLVVCRHTLEHIEEPSAVLGKLWDVAAEDALFVFEVPGFDALTWRMRFDHIFHQHLQYFTLASVRRLIRSVGGAFVGSYSNYHDWGAMIVAFKKHNHPKTSLDDEELVNHQVKAAAIRSRYELFRRQMASANAVLESLSGVVFGYGAAQMVPVLAYHLGSDLASLTAILDDDETKDGLRYPSLPVVIRHTGHVPSLEDASVFVTALDNVEAILTKLLKNRPRHIIYPLHII